MKTSKTKEWIIAIISATPLAYLLIVLNKLPSDVPLHWNIEGEADRFGSKMELFWMILIIPLGIYLLMRFLPKIDPKKKMEKMGGKYETVRLILAVFMSLVFCYVIYSTLSNGGSSPNFIFVLVGLFFFVLGNFFKTFKPNYFMGIRTPWTLENETVWKETHILAGKMWFVGGLLIAITALFLSSAFSAIIMFSITLIISIVPIIFSYRRFKELKNKEN